MNSFEDDKMIYKVVVNHEEQYSIWPVDKDNPLGWKDAGKTGTKEECLDHIEEVWTDMRPLSLRKERNTTSYRIMCLSQGLEQRKGGKPKPIRVN